MTNRLRQRWISAGLRSFLLF